MSENGQSDVGKTVLRRLAQYRDRWTSFDAQSGLVSLSDKPSVEELKAIDLFAEYDDGFLEKISPDVSIAIWNEGSVLFEEGTYIDLAFLVLDGEVEVSLAGVQGTGGGTQPIFDLGRTMAGAATGDAPVVSETTEITGGTMLMRQAVRASGSEITMLASMDFDLPRGAVVRLGAGEIFGEIGALSGWPQSVTARTASTCRLAQIRLPALRLMRRKSAALKTRLDDLYRERSLAAQLRGTPLFRRATPIFIEAVTHAVDLVSCDPGEVIVRQGEPADCVFLVRSGFVKLLQRFGEGELAVSYLSKGMTLGEVELLIEGVDGWQVTAQSVEYGELVRIPYDVLRQLMRTYPEVEAGLWQTATDRIREAGHSRRAIGQSEFLQVALDSGLMQGHSILAIDLNVCTRCDDCVRACAATHDGRPRFVREGDRYKNVLVARSCYHCRDPVCLVGCPTGAIHRAGVGELVAVDEQICIGCSNCARNCPYDAIVMHDTGKTWPEDMLPSGLRGRERQVASKCDLCAPAGHDPACVTNCPQGCAYRVGSLEEFERLLEPTG